MQHKPFIQLDLNLNLILKMMDSKKRKKHLQRDMIVTEQNHPMATDAGLKQESHREKGRVNSVNSESLIIKMRFLNI